MATVRSMRAPHSAETSAISPGARTIPFSLVYSGGVYFRHRTGNSELQTLSEPCCFAGLSNRAWVFVVTDSFSYLPDSPTTGLSGVAGVGDVGVFPVQTGLGPTQSILTNYSSRIANGLQGSATWQATPSLDLEGSAGLEQV